MNTKGNQVSHRSGILGSRLYKGTHHVMCAQLSRNQLWIGVAKVYWEGRGGRRVGGEGKSNKRVVFPALKKSKIQFPIAAL